MMNDDAWQPAALGSHQHSITTGANARLPTQQHFLFQVARLFQRAAPHIDRALADLLAETVTETDFIQGLDLTGAAACYTRQVIFAAPDYCVLALIWRPGQMSPVHNHRAACALGVHAGTLTETAFTPAPGGAGQGIRLTGCRQLYTGDTSHGPADEQSAHRVANLGVEPAISIHVYATGFDQLGTRLNRIWAD